MMQSKSTQSVLGGGPERAPLFFSADFANPFMEKNGYMQVKIL